MIVPQYWSESKLRKIVNGKQFTLKRFGWSDVSELEAKKHADERVREAEELLIKNGDVRRVDHKSSYNGAEGIPIREEVFSRHNKSVITRNGYGALCINTPNVFFADIDFDYKPSFKMYFFAAVFLLVIDILSAVYFYSLPVLLVGFFVVSILTSTFADIFNALKCRLKGDPEKSALRIIKNVSELEPSLHLRIYRTPMGYRILVMDRTFSPRENTTIILLNKFHSDSIYTLMCKNQNCFRARISPKPWRVDMDRLRPTPGVWPIKQKHMGKRKEWINEYNKRSQRYSSCHFVMQLGSHTVSSEAEYIRKLHDDHCKVDMKNLELA